MAMTNGVAVVAAFELRDVSKAFGGTVALDKANLVLAEGEIHALLGENGAGKSTLINIATGVFSADEGVLLRSGTSVNIATPGDAAVHGIAVVHQERNLVGGFSVAENMFLGRQPHLRGIIDYGRMFKETRQWLEVVGLSVNPRTVAAELSPGQSQLLEIARALSLRCRVLFLDEPTSSVAEREAEHLFTLLRHLREDGTAVVFVSHKLEEVYGLCDRVTVLRDGRNILSGQPLSETPREEVVYAMVGRSLGSKAGSVQEASSTRVSRVRGVSPRLELRRVSTEYGHRDVELAVFPGEIVGLYGLVGAGRTELARCIVGLGRVTAGSVCINGEVARVRNPYDALTKHSLGYLSEDRKGEGLILSHSVGRNIGITVWDRMRSRGGWISEGRCSPVVKRLAEGLRIKALSLRQAVAGLSGGNQQKVSLAKWLAAEVETLILDEPSVGIDVAAKAEVHDLIRRLATEGKAIVLITSDLREMIELAGRIVVMGGFQVIAEVENTGDYSTMSRVVMERITGVSV